VERHRGTAGLPDWIASVTGAAPAQSALTLRLFLAVFGLVLFASTAVLFAVLDLPAGLVIAAAVLAGIAAVDLIVITTRKHHGEPG
jgi:hypothetical protein